MEVTVPTTPEAAALSSNRPASRAVVSGQRGPHPRLAGVVKRHLESAWRAPLHGPTVEAFRRLGGLLGAGEEHRLVLDSGCGTGLGTRRLGELHPRGIVIGVDKSAARLRRGPGAPGATRAGNCIWLRGELGTFWRLAVRAGWRLRRHYLLYPNPWPKAAQLRRRWHAHPAFPALLALGGVLELRCNWKTYAEEFALAASLATGRAVTSARLSPSAHLTPFEAKYALSGHSLYRVRLPLP